MSVHGPLLFALALTDQEFFFSLVLSATISFFLLAHFIAPLSSFGRCPSLSFSRACYTVLLLLNLARVRKIIFFPLQNGIFFFGLELFVGPVLRRP